MNPVHRSEVRVRYKETDRMGVVHHSNYVVYFEMGRTEFMRDAGISYRRLEDDGVLLTVTRVEVNYRDRGHYEDDLVIETWIEEVRPVRLTFAYRVLRKDDERVLADGRTVLACVGRDFRPMRLPDTVGNVVRGLAVGPR